MNNTFSALAKKKVETATKTKKDVNPATTTVVDKTDNVLTDGNEDSIHIHHPIVKSVNTFDTVKWASTPWYTEDDKVPTPPLECIQHLTETAETLKPATAKTSVDVSPAVTLAPAIVQTEEDSVQAIFRGICTTSSIFDSPIEVFLTAVRVLKPALRKYLQVALEDDDVAKFVTNHFLKHLMDKTPTGVVKKGITIGMVASCVIDMCEGKEDKLQKFVEVIHRHLNQKAAMDAFKHDQGFREIVSNILFMWDETIVANAANTVKAAKAAVPDALETDTLATTQAKTVWNLKKPVCHDGDNGPAAAALQGVSAALPGVSAANATLAALTAILARQFHPQTQLVTGGTNIQTSKIPPRLVSLLNDGLVVKCDGNYVLNHDRLVAPMSFKPLTSTHNVCATSTVLNCNIYKIEREKFLVAWFCDKTSHVCGFVDRNRGDKQCGMEPTLLVDVTKL